MINVENVGKEGIIFSVGGQETCAATMTISIVSLENHYCSIFGYMLRLKFLSQYNTEIFAHPC